MKVMIGYLLIINTISALAMIIDKQRAIQAKWRISEKTLLLLSLCGGFIGSYGAMQLFRHKVRRRVFTWGVPLIALVWLIAFIYCLQQGLIPD